MHKLEELRKMLVKELDDITEKRELSAGSLEIIDKLTHSIKSIDTIMAMEGASYDGYSYRGRKRDSMGRYSRDDYSRDRDYSREDGYSRRGYYGESSYSRDDATSELMEGLKDLAKSAPDERTKHMINEWKRQLEG